MGAAMGIGVGLSIGFIGGAFQILRAGPGPKGSLATLSQFMGTSAATFGCVPLSPSFISCILIMKRYNKCRGIQTVSSCRSEQ